MPVCTDPVPAALRVHARASSASGPTPTPTAPYDLLVISDCGSLERIGEVGARHADLFARLPRVIIDHHASNDAAEAADWIEPDAAATCEMVTLLAARLGVPLDAGDGALAAALMAGIVMDTATFAHPNATPRTLVVSAALVEAGAPLSDISRRLYRTKPDAQLRLFGVVLDRLESADDGRIVWSTLTEADIAATGAERAHSEGIIDLLSQAEAAEVAILFKEAEAGKATRVSVRTKPGGVDATVLTGRFGGGGHARAAGASIASPVEDARPPVLAEADAARRRAPALTWRARRWAPGSTASSSSPSRPARPRTTSSPSSGGWPPRSASGTAGRSTRSRRACCRSSSATRTRVVEYHLGDRKAYRATVCFGASSTTDDLEGELTPADRPGARREPRSRRPLPGLTGPISQRPPAYSAIKVGGRRAYAMARAGETVELAPREVTIHALDLVSWDDTDPDRPDRRPRRDLLGRARTSGRWPATSARSLGSAAYLGALTRTASGPFTLEDATPLDEIRAAAAESPDGLKPLLLPLDTGLEAFPVVTLTADELAAVAKGQFIRPTGGLPGPADHYRLVGPDGALVAIALGRRRTARPGQGLRGARQRRSRRLTPMHVVQGIDELRPQLGPLFVVVGVFDGLHLGHAYLLEHLVAEAAARDARPTVITFDHHPDEVLMGKAPPLLLDPGERLERLEAAGVAVTVVQPFDEAVRQTPYDAFVERIRARVALRGFLMTPDAAFGFERRGTPAALAELGQRDGFDVVVVPTFGLDGQEVRSSTIREAIAAGDLTPRRACSAGRSR